MLSMHGIRHACSRTSHLCLLPSVPRHVAAPRDTTAVRRLRIGRAPIGSRFLCASARHLRAATAATEPRQPHQVEQVVRDAKQRFRDTLPRGYLNDEEYALYERLYGPPLRETAPEDVGIPAHADMGPAFTRPEGRRILLRQLQGGQFEEVEYELPHPADPSRQEAMEPSGRLGVEEQTRPMRYVEAVARNQREHDALLKLTEEHQARQDDQRKAEDDIVLQDRQEPDGGESWDWLAEEQRLEPGQRESGVDRRFHQYTLDGRFHGSPVEIALPREELVNPIRGLLDRSHLKHVKAAAEAAFGGRGLPTSPATPEGLRNGHMGGVGLPPDERQMTEIEADAFLAGYLPPAYASVMSVLREVRKRIGADWIQSRLEAGKGRGLSVLDAGAGGAGLVAWGQILNTEWQLLKEKGQVEGELPPGKKTVIAASDRLRNRIKSFLHNTTFLPRLPDYEHSGETRGERLEGGSEPQLRKSFDVIIASHLFLKEKQQHYRQAVLNNLWSLLNKEGGVLVVIEKAHPRGFEAVAHVRDTLLKQFLLPQSGEPIVAPDEFNPAFHRELEEGHIVAPCTNHGTCPMYKEEGKSTGRKDYCHFSQRFVRPTFYSRLFGSNASNQGEVEFSYVVVRRGVPKGSRMAGKEATEKAMQGYEASGEQPDMQTLPRLILPPLKRKGHVTLDLCTPEGRIERWTVPKSFSKGAYHDARKSRWGDLWALGAKTRVPRSVRAGNGADDGGRRSAKGNRAHRVEISMEDGRLSASEKNAPRDRRPKSKEAKKRDLVREILEAEEREEAAIEEDMDAEEELEEAAEWEETAGRGTGRRGV